MPPIKKSVMLSVSTHDYILARTKEDNISWSEMVNDAFKALKYISQQALPELSRSEWQKILDTYAGCTNFVGPFRIASDIMDNLGAIDLKQLDEKTRKLVVKCHAMNQVEQFAIHDFVNKYWSKNWDCEWDEIVEKIKNS